MSANFPIPKFGASTSATSPEVDSPEYKTAMQQLDDLWGKTLANGRLFVSATNGSGKTFIKFWMWRRMMEHPKHAENFFKSISFDPALNDRYGFDSVPYVDYNEAKIRIPKTNDLIIDLLDIDPLVRRQQMIDLMIMDYRQKRKLKLEGNGFVPFINIYHIDEMQTVFDTYSLNSNDGRHVYDMVCEGRNYGMCLIGYGQRMGEVSPKIIERTNQFLIGMTSGENDLKKIRGMFGNEVKTTVAALQPRDFMHYDKQTGEIKVIRLPDWIQRGKPYKGASLNLANGYVKVIRPAIRSM